MTGAEKRWQRLKDRNLVFGNMQRDQAGMAQRGADAPLRPTRPQLPADTGLFGDGHLQLDLVEMLQDPTNE